MLAWRARDIVRDTAMGMERSESGAGKRLSLGMRERRGREGIRGLYGREEGDWAGQRNEHGAARECEFRSDCGSCGAAKQSVAYTDGRKEIVRASSAFPVAQLFHWIIIDAGFLGRPGRKTAVQLCDRNVLSRRI